MFYYSYAIPIPAGRSAEGPRDDALFRKFFGDLSQAVAKLAPSSTAGYLADEQTRDVDRARALAACQAFVPLLSPLYFRSERCASDWEAFRSRVPVPDRVTRFVPVIWTPVSATAIPRALVGSEIGVIREDRPDTADGLYSLMIDADEAQYAAVVEDVATAIGEALRGPRLGVSRPADLTKLRSAFQAAPGPLRLRVLILAPTTDRLPSLRASGTAYGDRQSDWAPFGAEWGRSLAADVKDIAERLGYQPEVSDFDEVAPDLLASRLPAAPTLLLIDNWALLDAEMRAQVLEYLRQDKPWQLFMVVRDALDPETEQRVESLRNAVSATLETHLERMRIDVRHAASGEGSRARFALDFALVAGVAAGRFRRAR